MAANNTRERAVDAALTLFAQKGYGAVSMGDVAGALGIKAPSLYKYFKGKEELYQAGMDRLRAGDDARLADIRAQLERLVRDLRSLGLLSAERLEQETLAWVVSALHDPQARALRRILTLEQFSSPQAAQECEARLSLRLTELHGEVFAGLIDTGVLRRGEAAVMAEEFVAPICQLMAACDRRPQEEGLYLERLRRHVRQFHRVYAIRENHQQPAGGRFFRR